LNKKKVKDPRTERIARAIADFEAEAHAANNRERATLCRDALAALFGHATTPSGTIALATLTEEIARQGRKPA
jgi:hypothetical protein